MKQTDKMYFNIGMLLLGYAYAANNYVLPSLLCGIASILISIQAHSFSSIYRKKGSVCFWTIISCFAVEIMHLTANMPSLPFLCLANSIFAVAWSTSSRKAVYEPICVMLGMWLTVTMLTLLLPTSVIPFLANALPHSRMAILTFTTQLFLPSGWTVGRRMIFDRIHYEGSVMKLNKSAQFAKIKQ